MLAARSARAPLAILRGVSTPSEPRGPRVLVVGSGWRFTSGISYYTCRLSNAFSEVTPTSALLMRRLVPRALYPGRARVGVQVNALEYAPGVPVLDGVDWYWGSSMLAARRFLREQRPDVVVLQWWTGAVLHSYLAIATLARRQGATVVIEWHEVQDTGEARIPGVVRYVRAAVAQLLRRADGHVVHNKHDLELLQAAYDLPPGNVVVAPHGPYDHHAGAVQATGPEHPDAAPVDDDGRFVFLYFGIVRPYKGVEDLVAAWDLLPAPVREGSRLVLVGEKWEGWDAPFEAVAASPSRESISVVDRYVTDPEVQAYFGAADAVVLPYKRSSSSGPLHIAMSAGLPVVVTAVGGLVEAAGDYAGTVFAPPEDPAALSEAMQRAYAMRGQRFEDPHSWSTTLEAYADLLRRLGARTWNGS
ncbi:glycosyltransferase involved in cell wall biosynthesis [Motilibacter peucedani]|uniref:Glycosyltransferase involved in cell wall biosynthesis n=1 Tax=Motilibacter peucedani TaxID=598650 RepID=A0A420XLB2_9ACTN|nr:glycosyltransferase involved in cell wall biosynthesis [Motilibacter peucedani]